MKRISETSPPKKDSSRSLKLFGILAAIAIPVSLNFRPTALRSTLPASLDLKAEKQHAVNSTSNTLNNNAAAYAYAYAYELQSTVNNYTWESNTSFRWIPPMDVPELLPIDIRRIFLSENTAWMGDSTLRQDYQTMYHVIHSEHATSKTLDLPTEPLNKYINRGKRSAFPKEFYCAARQQPEMPWHERWVELAQVKGADMNCSATVVPEKIRTWAYFALNDGHGNGKGKFDYQIRNCFRDILKVAKKRSDFLRRHYSVLVVTDGIWELVFPRECKMEIEVAGDEPNTTVSQMIPFNEVLTDLLNALMELSGPSFFVVFKTFGPSKYQSRQKNNTMYNWLNGVTRDWFVETKPLYMDLVDFDKAIEERSFGEIRIHGDLKSHWGLEARLLSINMISDVVRRKQIRGVGAGS